MIKKEKRQLEDRIVQAEFIKKERDKLLEENETIKEELEIMQMRTIKFDAKSETQCMYVCMYLFSFITSYNNFDLK